MLLKLITRITKLPKKILVMGGAFALVVPVVGLLGIASISTSYPGYCLSCHATGETANMGKASLVHPSFDKVGCVQCHATPGRNLLNVVYDGWRGGYDADPKLVSDNCITCHGDITKTDNDQSQFKFNPLGINIPHKLHVEGVKAKCVDCHADIAHDLRDNATNRPQMEYCFKCHAANTACNKCHTKAIPSQGSSQKF